MNFNKQHKPLNRFERTERVNLALLGYIIELFENKEDCPLLKDATARFEAKDNKQDDSVEQHAKRLYMACKHIGGGIGLLKSRFRQPHDPYGRLNAVENLSLAVTSRPIRHAISGNLYIDIDIRNCHIAILHQYCRKNNIECYRVQDLAEDRDNIIDTILQNNPSMSKDEIKTLIIAIMNGGGRQRLLMMNNSRFLNSYAAEMRTILENILNLKQNSKVVLQVIKSETGNTSDTPSNRSKIPNLAGKVISRVLQDIENEMLICIESAFVNNGFSIDDLIPIHDGTQIPRGIVKDEKIPDIIRQAERAVQTKLGYTVEIVEKPMDKHLELNFNPPEFTEAQIQDYSSRVFDIESKDIVNVNYMFDKNDPFCFVHLREELRKKIFDSENESIQYLLKNAPRVLYVLDYPQGWLVKDYTGEVEIKQQLPISYITYKTKTKSGELEDTQLLQKFLQNPKIYNCLTPIAKIVFDPNPNFDTKFLYNTFQGFQGMPPMPHSVPPSSSEMVIIAPLINHIREVLADSNEDIFDYIVSYFAHIIQTPHEKTKIFMMFVSELQQVGKNIFLTFLQRFVFGSKYAMERTGLDSMLDDKNGDFENCILCIVNEISIKSYQDYNLIKDRITSPTRRLRKLYFDAIEIADHTNYVGTSNDMFKSIRVERGDARTAVFEINPKYKNNYKYFDKILECFNEEAGQIFYRYLFHYKITRQLRDIPNTRIRSSMIDSNTNSLEEFLSELKEIDWASRPSPTPDDWTKDIFMNRTNDGLVPVRSFYKSYKMFCQESGEKVYSLKFIKQCIPIEESNRLKSFRLFDPVPVAPKEKKKKEFVCDLCDYKTGKTSSFENHKRSMKHIQKYNKQN